ncbi:hypothetical protein PGT21_005505 [Puccinia graminis f. sp. tritici]|uniref:Uncharacterized protein n=1 Tax=Puccinia graminis f. sp. tritici TaxID=56615 RepID=A0A5B0RLW2_PUCGR|nr:hypothetical protein PGT21_017822 [Puccinia graminis f. sp. tritici]KAA1073683.1 hypothetical protein PGT21_022512 [Puccinia graminis f. sp. tritici]KAA1079259.1 hypothetical protein PGT21_005505 [Puccinia graminis f. sp. tritici]KAA1082278.1 hypothetical protein PGTUg99_031205 [Puccinia graminis f. sp. tritici]KAA1093589.1 hypothetical protein PGTUg99_029741 [Puccinia graminis f. sp. tritici]
MACRAVHATRMACRAVHAPGMACGTPDANNGPKRPIEWRGGPPTPFLASI